MDFSLKMCIKMWLSLSFLVVTSTSTPIVSPVQPLSKSNFSDTLESYEVVFVNFYAEWCHFSSRLMPIFEAAALNLSEELPGSAKVLLGRVDCMRETELANLCAITKFPTLQLYNRGNPMRSEYRGQRAVDALVEYVKEQLRWTIRRFEHLERLKIDVKRRSVIGFFEAEGSAAFDIFEKLAELFKQECDFYLRVGPTLHNVSYTQHMPTIIYHPDNGNANVAIDAFKGDLIQQQELEEWLMQKCVPLVHEVNFENVEELIERGLPLLVLFHLPSDKRSVADFKSIIESELKEHRDFIFGTVDGLKFEHAVHQLGKSKKDLPIIAIDSLKRMYPYANFEDMFTPGHLKQFVQHFKLNETSESSDSATMSTFKLLGPSKHRYSLLAHDEL